jgi:hypothetical protein
MFPVNQIEAETLAYRDKRDILIPNVDYRAGLLPGQLRAVVERFVLASRPEHDVPVR